MPLLGPKAFSAKLPVFSRPLAQFPLSGIGEPFGAHLRHGSQEALCAILLRRAKDIFAPVLFDDAAIFPHDHPFLAVALTVAKSWVMTIKVSFNMGCKRSKQRRLFWAS